MTRFVTRALRTIRRYDVAPEKVDFAILCAINATLCVRSNGDDRVAEGFNKDIAVGRGRFEHGSLPETTRFAVPFPLSPKRLASRVVQEKIEDVLRENG